jgi:hypothetical protein
MAPRGGCCSPSWPENVPPLFDVGRFGDVLRIRSLAGSIIDTLESSLRPLEPRNLALVADLELEGAWRVEYFDSEGASASLIAFSIWASSAEIVARSGATASIVARTVSICELITSMVLRVDST